MSTLTVFYCVTVMTSTQTIIILHVHVNVLLYIVPQYHRHNMGYVTCNQFHQCLAYLGLSVSPAHMRLLEMKFGDQKGFNYLKFLDHLQPSEKLENKYQTRMAQLMTKKEQVYTEYHDIVSFVMCMLVIFCQISLGN